MSRHAGLRRGHLDKHSFPYHPPLSFLPLAESAATRMWNCQLKPRSGSRDTGRNEEVPVYYFLPGIFLDLDLFFACRLQAAWE
jgi:hypothetical protein